RIDHPDIPRPYRIGRKGNGKDYTVAIVLILSILIVVITTLVSSTWIIGVLVSLITIIMFVIPLLINNVKKDTWLTETQKDLEL
ncbi:amino acid permease, partial [Staphylococcus epidermidis]